MLSFSTYVGIRGAVDLSKQWQIAEDSAAEHGQQVDRNDWRLVVPVHLAETREEALADAANGGAAFVLEYQERVLGRPSPVDGPPEAIVRPPTRQRKLDHRHTGRRDRGARAVTSSGPVATAA